VLAFAREVRLDPCEVRRRQPVEDRVEVALSS